MEVAFEGFEPALRNLVHVAKSASTPIQVSSLR
jgi:hypothetical protein